MLRHFAFRVHFDDKVHMAWGVIICSWCVRPKEIFAICIFSLEGDVLAYWQTQFGTFSRQTKPAAMVRTLTDALAPF